jgi:hypothetical protein
MAVPNFLSGNYRYLSTAGVTNVNTIITDLNAELITNGVWTGGVTGTPGTTNYTLTATSAVRSDGAYAVLVAVWVSATRIKFTFTDRFSLLVNNQTDTRLDIDAGGTEVRYYTNAFGLCVDSNRATPECFIAGMLDRTPATFAIPHESCYASAGPRNNAGTLTTQTIRDVFLLAPGGTAYATGTSAGFVAHQPLTGTMDRYSMTGAYFCTTYEFCTSQYSMGRVFQAIMVPSTLAFGTEIVVPIDTGTTGTFKVVGLVAGLQARVAYRKA